jgi:outer membrane protein assembly factor BamB
MTNSKSKTTTIVAALLIILAMAISLLALPAEKQSATAQITTWPFIGAIPNPASVNQEVLLHIGITASLGSVEMGWEDLWVTIERPDNKTDTIENIRTDSTGGTGRTYVPDMPGTYYLQTHFPAQNTTDYWGEEIAYAASESEILELVVQEDPIPIYPGHALPTEYWTRPIDSQLREWYAISGSWLTKGWGEPENFYAPGNDDAPESPHILWSKQMAIGGVAGGETTGEHMYSIGDAYEGKFNDAFIVSGILIYTFDTHLRPLEYTAIDLHTSEELWTKTFLDNRTIDRCQIFYWDTYNHHACYAYLWVTVGSTWYGFDPFIGDLRLTITDVPSGTTIVDKTDGRIYRYSINLEQGRMTLWNLSAVVSWTGSWGPGSDLEVYNASEADPDRAYALNFTFQQDLPGSVRKVWLGDRVLGASINTTHVVPWSFSLAPGDEGSMIYQPRTWNAPSEWEEGDQEIEYYTQSLIAEDGVFVLFARPSLIRYGFSTETGEFLWETEGMIYLNFYGISRERMPVLVDGKLYTSGTGGIVYCTDTETGDELWTYEAEDPYVEFLFGNNWWLYPLFWTDGKIYYGHLEHSPIDPRPRGAPLICLNATTGEVIWRANGLFRQTLWGGRALIGDSIIATMDTYSQRLFAIGKGASAMTVSAGPKVSVEGDMVLVEGMVTDVSPGTNDIAITTRFPNGVPAVSDANMSEWMQYVYKQFERPADIIGVDVVVEVLDPNNNAYEVARTTSDASGFFSVEFEPEVPGKYTIVASFDGSKSYYGAFAETAVFVKEAPAATPPPTPEPESVADLYFVPMSIGMIVAIVVVGLLLFLMLRRR